jgi:NAD-dependent deacetylase
MGKKKLIVLTGAGVSAESGLKTFRDSDGLWEGYKIQDVATPGAWHRNPQLVLDFYNQRRRDIALAQPNVAHTVLAQLENKFSVTIITQNIDDLHERAGSTNVLHLHGEIFKMCSEANKNKTWDIRTDMHLGLVANDGYQLRPFIVWFEEPVPLIHKAAEIVQTADIFVVVGTSLQVYPAAGLVNLVAATVPKFVIDKNIPVISSLQNITSIEKTATEGLPILKQLLENLV